MTSLETVKPPPAPVIPPFSAFISANSNRTKSTPHADTVTVDRRDIIEKIRRIINYVLPSKNGPLRKIVGESSQQEFVAQTPEGMLQTPKTSGTTTVEDLGGGVLQSPERVWSCRIMLVHTSPVQQVGPSCGFAALSICGQLLPPKKPVSDIPGSNAAAVASEMLRWARVQSYTNMGEMFSTLNLMSTLKHHFECSARLRDFSAIEPDAREAVAVREITEHVKQGGLVLVPYDKGPNHEPAQRNGHAAHWCVIVGLVQLQETYQSPHNSSCLTYAVCRHGASVRHALWHLGELVRSNQGLREFGPRRLETDAVFVVSDFKDLKDLRATAVFVDVSRTDVIWRQKAALDALVAEFCF